MGANLLMSAVVFDVIGWLGTTLVVISLTQKRALRLHISNLISAVILIAYSAFALTRRRALELRLATVPGRVADGGVGVVGGVLGGIAGLSAVLPSLWMGMRGWTKPEQRGLLQSYGFYTQALTLTVLAGVAGFDAATLGALAICLPIAVAGSLAGLWLFRRMSGDVFRRAVLGIVLAGGIGLLVRTL